MLLGGGKEFVGIHKGGMKFPRSGMRRLSGFHCTPSLVGIDCMELGLEQWEGSVLMALASLVGTRLQLICSPLIMSMMTRDGVGDGTGASALMSRLCPESAGSHHHRLFQVRLMPKPRHATSTSSAYSCRFHLFAIQSHGRDGQQDPSNAGVCLTSHCDTCVEHNEEGRKSYGSEIWRWGT